ncbi:FtsX-like permease family protein [Mucilaginibacter corticis]|uniref:FtsX-like permease family protein n=1 Tax=Mucilaginibacter corticis TaxID=2597670 RepID=A0A556MSW4_9SPHI|nr:ABC transporter permease [Mucilaginibacter corticis]TSJ43041.1 FtsX-like permease family protein [Mucilaginibacter corticis]
MIKNYFKIAWRNIVRHKAYSAINVAGLAIGVAACLLIFVVIQFELSYDKFQPNYNKIYRVVMQQKSGDVTEFYPGIPYPMSEALRVDFPGSKFATVQTSYGSQITVPANTNNTTISSADKKFTEDMGVLFIQPQFFDIFKYKWLSGGADVLEAPNTVVINRSTANKYFGDWKNAGGKVIRMDNRLTLKVGGIIEDVPSNTDLPLRVLVSYSTLKSHLAEYDLEDSWGNNSSNHEIFMMPPDNQSVSTINTQLKIFTQKHYGKNEAKTRFHLLQPLSDMHFDTRFGNTLGDHITNKATIRTLSFIAVLIILMASINFINLSTAQSVGRSKEVGIRKVLGSSRVQLIKQSIGETGLIVIFALIIAIGIAKLALPYLKNIASVPDDINLISEGSVIFLSLMTLAIVLISGIYPALVVSGFRPVLALKNKITAASVGGVPLRRVLVVTQFSISQLLIIGTIVAVKQMNFVNTADLGFNKEAVLIIPGSTDSISLQKSASFKQMFLQNPGVKSVSFISDQPSSQNNWSANFYFDNSGTDKNYHLYMKFGDADYFKTFGLRFKAGQPYSQKDTTSGIVINETFAKKLGIQNANAIIGKTIKIGGGKWHPIVGVVEDFKTNTLREAVKPTIIIQDKKEQGEIAVKLNTRNLSRTVASVQKAWETTYPEYAYNGYFLDQNIADFYKQENQLALIYKIFAMIAIFISCLGLYGLVSFMVVQRTKEVGVRKVLGASISSIVYLFSKEFMALITVSFLIATPLAYYMMNSWLQNFVFRIPLSATVFILAIAASIIIAWLTVGYKAITAALANPVKSLRSE